MTKQSNQNIHRVTKRTYKDFMISGGKLVYVPTGEIISDIVIILDHYNMTIKLERETSIPSDYYYNNWQRSNKFTKIYQIEPRILNSELSLQAKGLLFVFMTHLVKSTNEVIIDGKRPTNKHLTKLTGVSNSTINRLLLELESFNVIKRKDSHSSRVILVNPYVCFNGKNLAKSTLNQFKIDQE